MHMKEEGNGCEEAHKYTNCMLRKIKEQIKIFAYASCVRYIFICSLFADPLIYFPARTQSNCFGRDSPYRNANLHEQREGNFTILMTESWQPRNPSDEVLSLSRTGQQQKALKWEKNRPCMFCENLAAFRQPSVLARSTVLPRITSYCQRSR